MTTRTVSSHTGAVLSSAAPTAEFRDPRDPATRAAAAAFADDMCKHAGTVELLAVAGSHAYGLAHAESDIDLRGMHVAPTSTILGIFAPVATVNSHDPIDLTTHELAKFAQLAAAANPTVLETLFVGDYLTLREGGALLVEERHVFLSRRVVDTFGGYATQQFRRLEEGGGTFSSDTAKRTAKHARHCFRLLQQGAAVLRTGTLCVQVEDPGGLFEVGEMAVSGAFDELRRRYEAAREALEAAVERSPLPAEPDMARVDMLVRAVRRLH